MNNETGPTSEEITRKSGSNLALSFFSLGEEERKAMNTFYAFCRVADDIVDEKPQDQASCKNRIGQWRAEISACYTGTPSSPLGRELAEVIRRYLIPPQLFEDILLGVEMDLTQTRYDTFAQLETYCYRVASAVGLVSINIFGCKQAQSRNYAVALGMAFQLTNILRDVAEDYHHHGRIYLPRDEMDAFGVTEEDIRLRRFTPQCERLFRMQAFRAEHYYNKAERLLDERDRPQLRAALIMREVYHTLLKKIEAHRFNVLERSLRLSKWEKIRAILRVKSKPPTDGRAPLAPPRDLAVFGGGFAGVSAAIYSARQGHKVTLYESKAYMGGRAHSFTEAKSGDVIDNGQHIFMGCYHSCMDLIELLGVSHKLRKQRGLDLTYWGRKEGVSRLKAANLPAPFHLLAALAGFGALNGKDRIAILGMGLRLRMGMKPEPDATVAAWLTSWGQTPGAIRALWEPLCIAALNEPIATGHATLFFEVVRRSIFGSKADSAIYLSAVGLSDLMMPEAGWYLKAVGGEMKTGSAIKSLLINNSKLDSFQTSTGQEVKPDAAISTVPWNSLASLLPVNHPLRDKISRIPSSPIIGIHLWVDRPLSSQPIVGFLDSPIHWMFDCAHIKGTPATETGHHYALIISAAYDWREKKSSDIIDTAVNEIRALMPEKTEFHVLHSLVYKSLDATFASRPDIEPLRPGFSSGVGNLILAGDWIDTKLPGTLEGAVWSGQQASNQISANY